ncbi:MAG: hypothetical protein Q8L27_03870 [archaeon]|nr:hypothetical protein [archaeon]
MHTTIYNNPNNAGSQYFLGNNEASKQMQVENPTITLQKQGLSIRFRGRLASEPQIPTPDLTAPSFLESEEFLWKNDPEEAQKRYGSL